MKDKKEVDEKKEIIKTRVKKCLGCFKNTTSTKKCEHCGLTFKSARKRNWRDKLKDIVTRLTYG